MKISACKVLKGKVLKVEKRTVNSEVVLELPGGATIVPVITNSSIASLGLKSASNVMVAVD